MSFDAGGDCASAAWPMHAKLMGYYALRSSDSPSAFSHVADTSRPHASKRVKSPTWRRRRDGKGVTVGKREGGAEAGGL